MKQLTKLGLLVLLVTIFFQASSQKLSIKGGLNFSTLSYHWNEEDWSDQFSSRLGFQLGAMAELPISENYALNMGVMLVQRRFLHEYEPEPGDEWHLESNRWYVEVPVLLRREFKLNSFSVFGEFGPYAGIGVAISEDIKNYQNGELRSEGSFYAEWGTGENDTKRFDAGLSFGLGILINKFELGFSYAHGFINAQNVDYRERKNRAFFINCAYPLFVFKE